MHQDPPPDAPSAPEPAGVDGSFRLLADDLPALCWIADGDGYIGWYSRRWHEYCGTTAAEMEGWGWQAVHDPAVLPSVMAGWTAAIASGEPFEMTFPLRAADGSFRPFLTRVRPVRGADGRVVRWLGVNTDVADQMTAETALRAERDRTRHVLDNMDEGFVLLDRDFRVLDINAEALRMERRFRSEIVGLTHWDAWPGSADTERAAVYRRAMAGRTRFSLDHSHVWPDGREAWLEVRGFPSGEGLAFFYRDITQRRADQMSVAESEARFRTVAETMPGFVWTAGEDGGIDYASPHWNAYSGTDPADSRSSGWTAFVHPDDQPRAGERWRAAVASGDLYEVDFRLRRADGVWRWWLARGRRVDRPGVGGRCWIGTCTDIDDIIAARDVLARSRAQLEQEVQQRTAERDRIWRLVPDLLMTGSLDGRLLSVNAAWTEALGHDEATLLGCPFEAMIHPDDLADSVAALAEIGAGRSARHRNRVRTASGDYRWFDWVGTPAGDSFYAVARDITEEKRRESELALAQEALRQSQKMEAVGQLTGGIAHDFNNMLAVVIGSLELLGRRIGDGDARATRHVEAAGEAARRAALLTQRLLAFSRQQPLQPETVDMNKLVGGMSQLLRHSLGPDVRLETVLAGGLWRTHVDPNQMENVILNLGVNARDAMPDGGRLTIETQNAHLDERYAATHLGVPAGHYVLVAVTDTGSGMPDDVIAKAFDPFFTTKAVGKGTGLGLSQVYGFVKQSGGHVKIYSETGHGTTVKIYLPRGAGPHDPAPRAELRQDVPLGDRGEVILVVEDEPAVRLLSVDTLTELGYRVLEAEDAAAALALLDQHPEIVLMFTDVVMPDMNGARLAEEARRRRPALKVLFTTGYTRNAVVHNGVLDAGVALIGKPFGFEELAAKVRQVLDG